MHPQRRRWLLAMGFVTLSPLSLRAARAQPAPVSAQPSSDGTIQRGRVLAFPRDHGAHPAAHTEWWYATGWLGAAAQPGAAPTPSHGFQVTFFRTRTGLAEGNTSRFAARQLLFAHAAVTDLAGGRHLHDQRIARWSGAADAPLGHADSAAGQVLLQDWWLRDEGGGWLAHVAGGGQGSADFVVDLNMRRSQPLLLQGEAGFSRKGPQEQQASHYYSEPQLAATGQLGLPGSSPNRGPVTAQGRAWMDHEWSDEILHPDAVGWDWIGMNLFDGSALTAFVLRRRDGSALWAGGSFRRPPASGEPAQAFLAPDAVRWQPGRLWRSPGSGASYPVEWSLQTPAGSFAVRALLDAQELDSRASTGTIYWEGLSELLDARGARIGLGYLEMTGYAARITL